MNKLTLKSKLHPNLTVAHNIKWLKVIAIQLLSFCSCVYAQPVSFHHINTANGLSDNSILSIGVDKKGFLWVGTPAGLNVYDGYSCISYFKDKQPAMASNNVIHLTCDSYNNTWMGTPEGVSYIDDRRVFHRVTLEDTITRFSCRTVQETKTYGIVIYSNFGQYYRDEKTGKWKKLTWIPEKLKYDLFFDAEPYAEDQIIYTTNFLVAILDYKTKQITYEQFFDAPVSACKTGENEIAIGQTNGYVKVVDIISKKIKREYQLTNKLDGKIINTSLSEVRCAPNGDILVATAFAGLVNINNAGVVTSYQHDAINPASISSNNNYRVLTVSNGDVLSGTATAGLNIYNIYNKQAGHTPIFNDTKGKLYDNFLDEIIEDKNHVLWMGGYDRMIRWDKKANQSRFYYCYLKNESGASSNLQIRSLCFDKNGKLWVSCFGDGVAIFNQSSGTFTKLKTDTGKVHAMKSPWVYDLVAAADGNIWACTNNGLYAVNPSTLIAHGFENDPVLNEIATKRAIALYEDSKKRIWIGVTGKGIYCYDATKKELKNFTTKNGLMASESWYGFMEHSDGSLFAASAYGFSIIYPNGTVKNFTRANGLRYDRCEGFLEDQSGNMWIANTKCLLKLDPVKLTMEIFNENAGISNNGFRINSYCKTADGELFWGGQQGVNYFYPNQILNHTTPLKVNINSALLDDSTWNFTQHLNASVPYSKNNVQFHFGAIDLLGSNNIGYQYMLEGYDKDWQSGIDTRMARYTSLPAGKFTFKVRASADMINWTNSGNHVSITIIPPIWQRWWFVTALFLALAGIFYSYIEYRNNRLRKQKEDVETQKAINHFASSLYEQKTVETILWDVAKNCISRLHFEDCVIYLLDEQRNVLIQKAAHGPKNPRQFEIQQPLEIPVGVGIVGSVAESGRAELINDTSLDARYIVDDERRYSEISVPIVSDNKVLGVIDCEHSRKNFFTQKHLSILTTIASLCANKIIRARSEEEKRKAELILLDTQKKMADMEMQALRAQMNPHFIFNCLNSINRYIVKSDQATASLYLTRFAKLIRLILENSNAKNVILSNEIEALKLYIEMEALRFDKKFNYKIMVDHNVNPDSIEVPPLIIQPYVENAIWHGLLHKESGGQLNLSVKMLNENMLECIIEDNGVGRAKAKELKSKSATTRKSLGMKLTEGRISLLNKHAELNASVDIIDLTSFEDQAAGTRVILKIPV